MYLVWWDYIVGVGMIQRKVKENGTIWVFSLDATLEKLQCEWLWMPC